MPFLEGLAISFGGNLLSGLFGGRGGGAPRETPSERLLRETSAKAMQRGMEQIEYLTPLFRNIAEEDIRRYKEAYDAYRTAVSRLTEVLGQPFYPELRERLGELEKRQQQTTESLLRGGVNPAVAEALGRIQAERAYYDIKERMRLTKLQQQLQALSAIGSLLGYSSAPIGALSAIGEMASSMFGGGAGGLSNVVQSETQRMLAQQQLSAQRQQEWSNLFTTLGMLIAQQ